MRKIILSLTLAAGILGITALAPTKANAFWIRTPYGMMNYNAYGAYNSMYMSGWPAYNPYYRLGNSYGWAYTSPAAYRYMANYNYVMSLYATRSMAATLYHPSTGYSYRFVTPAYSGYMISPYVGYQNINVPSSTYTIPLGNIYYYGGYMTPSYYNPYLAYPRIY
jgi:hypothetical protein